MLKLPQELLLSQLFHELNLDISTSCPQTITSLADLKESDLQSLVFIFNKNELSLLDQNPYAFCFIDSSIALETLPDNCQSVPQARLLFQKTLHYIDHLFFRRVTHSESSPAARAISPLAQIGDRVTIGPFCTIGDYVVLEDGVTLGSHVVIEQGSQIGQDSVIEHHTTIGSRAIIKENVYIGPHCAIASQGFGFEKDLNGQWQPLAHLSSVYIDSHSFLGAHVCVDAGILKPTKIDKNVIIDNFVQIAHHVHIQEGTAIAGCVGIAGSATVGKNCLIGGGTCINGHITISDHCVLTGMSMVTGDLKKPGAYSSGIPVTETTLWKRNAASFSHLAQLRKDINQVKKTLNKSINSHQDGEQNDC